MSIQKVFEQQQEIDSRGWQTFESEYMQRNPIPSSDNRLQRYGMTVGLVSAMVVSSIFTVQAFQTVFQLAGVPFLTSTIGSIAAFLMIDVILFFLTSFIVDLVYKPQALAGVMDAKVVIGIAIGIAAFTFVVSLASNMYFMLVGFDVMTEGGDDLRRVGLLVGILLGSAPPIQSVAVGTIVAMLPLSKILEVKSWEKGRNRAWRSFRKKNGMDIAIEASIERLSVQDETFMNIHEIHETPVKRTPTRQKVHEYLNLNPFDVELPIAALSNKLELSVGLVSEERNRWKQENSV